MVYRRKSVDSGTYDDDTVYVSGWTEESQQPKSESQRLLDRVSDLISSLHHVQNTRLSSQPPDHLSDVSGPSSEESELGNFHQFYAVMLSSRTSWPRGQNFVLGLEELSLARPRTFYFGLTQNQCNDRTANHCEFAMIIYQLSTYFPCVIDINLFKCHVHGSI